MTPFPSPSSSRSKASVEDQVDNGQNDKGVSFGGVKGKKRGKHVTSREEKSSQKAEEVTGQDGKCSEIECPSDVSLCSDHRTRDDNGSRKEHCLECKLSWVRYMNQMIEKRIKECVNNGHSMCDELFNQEIEFIRGQQLNVQKIFADSKAVSNEEVTATKQTTEEEEIQVLEPSTNDGQESPGSVKEVEKRFSVLYNGKMYFYSEYVDLKEQVLKPVRDFELSIYRCSLAEHSFDSKAHFEMNKFSFNRNGKRVVPPRVTPGKCSYWSVSKEKVECHMESACFRYFCIFNGELCRQCKGYATELSIKGHLRNHKLRKH